MHVERIEDLHDPRLNEYRDLKRTNATREMDYFIAEGRLVTERLLHSNFTVRSLLLSDKRRRSFAPQIPAGTRVLSVTHALCSQLVGFDFHAGVMASANRRRIAKVQPEWVQADHALVVCCPNTSLPDNLGSIIRLAAAFHAAGILVGPQSADPFARRVVRVSMGAGLALPVIEPADLPRELMRLREVHEFELIATGRRAGATPLQELARAPRRRRIVMLGNEAHGLEEHWMAMADRTVEIEMSTSVDSLNVASAAAITLYELHRARITSSIPNL